MIAAWQSRPAPHARCCKQHGVIFSPQLLEREHNGSIGISNRWYFKSLIFLIRAWFRVRLLCEPRYGVYRYSMDKSWCSVGLWKEVCIFSAWMQRGAPPYPAVVSARVGAAVSLGPRKKKIHHMFPETQARGGPADSDATWLGAWRLRARAIALCARKWEQSARRKGWGRGLAVGRSGKPKFGMQPSYGSSKRGAGSQSKEEEILRDAGLGGIGKGQRGMPCYLEALRSQASRRGRRKKLVDEHSQAIRPRKEQLNEILLGKSVQQAGRLESPESKVGHGESTYVLRRFKGKRTSNIGWFRSSRGVPYARSGIAGRAKAKRSMSTILNIARCIPGATEQGLPVVGHVKVRVCWRALRSQRRPVPAGRANDGGPSRNLKLRKRRTGPRWRGESRADRE